MGAEMSVFIASGSFVSTLKIQSRPQTSAPTIRKMIMRRFLGSIGGDELPRDYIDVHMICQKTPPLGRALQG